MKLKKTLTIVNKLGLHARAATKLVQLANSYDCDIVLEQGTEQAPANSVLALLMLQSSQGKQVTLICNGNDAELAMQSIENLIANKFDEGE
ncbi:phosphocarrier protein NPr [Glaciecola punicea ACAM 611]|jgi:phosphocarrier protein NPr|uniref:Phosphocarrier protein NPr n=1 Tax=Glaciecola punicea ACAM 611 TaxID=1121923 RepID=H5T8J3_9ALTE|nr:HPr family phosphocarrier protein [Glaciecola punicea]OFA30494.1 phosphate ABC transporter permease [Glaciecola punicea]GAB54634.1 phosphocarrier protein NPr [Glaciecola punicea ACAM 611]